MVRWGPYNLSSKYKTKLKIKFRCGPLGSLQFVIKIKGIFFPKDKANLNQRIKGFLPKRQWFFLG